MATTVGDIIRTIESLASGRLVDDEGVQLGPDEREAGRCLIGLRRPDRGRVGQL